MNVKAEDVKRLRAETGAGFLDCRDALKESQGDFEKAVQHLKKKDMSRASRKLSREAKEGMVVSYIHAGGRAGALVEVNTETDFAAKNQLFKDFAESLTLHITAMRPQFLNEESAPADVRERELAACKERAALRAKGKPPAVAEKISQGLYDKWLSEVCLMRQEFTHPSAQGKETVEAALKALISRLGENVVIRRFARFSLGEGQ